MPKLSPIPDPSDILAEEVLAEDLQEWREDLVVIVGGVELVANSLKVEGGHANEIGALRLAIDRLWTIAGTVEAEAAYQRYRSNPDKLASRGPGPRAKR
jgi:hypothetical protein